MSNIPNSAIPHAKASDSETKDETQKKSRGASIKKGATKLKDKAKENPKTAIAAGAAVVAAAVGAAVYVAWVAGYFVSFWSTTGQTPGDRAMRIRVRPQVGDVLPPRRALVRFVGLTLAAIPLFAGYLMILVDDRRRGLHDVLARTVVVDARDR